MVRPDRTRSTPPPSSSSPASRPTTCWPSRPTSPACWTAASVCHGPTSLSWTAPATGRTAGSSSAPSRPSPSAGSPSRTPRKVVQVTRKTATLAGGGGPWSSPRSPASPSPRPAPPGSPTSSGALGDRERPALRPGRDLRRGRLPAAHGTGPQVMACLRNLVIGALSHAGPVNLAAAVRQHARDPHPPPWPPSGSPSDEPNPTQGCRSPGSAALDRPSLGSAPRGSNAGLVPRA
jgi:hypothetical protein